MACGRIGHGHRLARAHLRAHAQPKAAVAHDDARRGGDPSTRFVRPMNSATKRVAGRSKIAGGPDLGDAAALEHRNRGPR